MNCKESSGYEDFARRQRFLQIVLVLYFNIFQSLENDLTLVWLNYWQIKNNIMRTQCN